MIGIVKKLRITTPLSQLVYSCHDIGQDNLSQEIHK
jgi:hypothetical protein